MADEISPTIEEPTAEVEVKQEPEQMGEEAQLLELLKSAGMTKPEQVEGTIRNAKRTFEMQSERDRLANEMAELKKAIASQNTKPQENDEYGQPVDLAGEMNRILDAREREKEKAQLAQQQRMMQAWNNITGDEDYHLVRDVWEQKLKDPNFVMGIQMGQTDPMQEYQRTLRTFYKGIAKKSVETIEKLRGGGGGQAPVHVESGDARVPSMPPTDQETSEFEEKLQQYKESADKGKVLSSDEEMDALRAALLM